MSAAVARQTRASIVARAVATASVTGLEGLTIGRLATDLGISKSGLLGHFGTKEALQLAVLDAAGEIFWREVWEPVAATPAGLPRFRAVALSWLSYLERDVFPGGCLFVTAAIEFDDRPGPVRDAVLGYATRWQRELLWQLHRATDAGQLSPDTDPEQVVFELTGLVLTTHQALRLRRDPQAPRRARQALERLLAQAASC